MTDRIDFEDAAFVGRLQVWADARRTDDRAPDHLVRSVMAGVARAPRRRFRLLPFAAGAGAAYGAIAAIILVSVTFGVFLARTFDAGPGESNAPIATPSPTPSPTPTPTVGPAPVQLVRRADVGLPARAIAALADSLWIADATGVLSELDPRDGTVIRSIPLPRVPAALVVTPSAVWAASPDGALVQVDRTTERITEYPGAAGATLVADGGRIWVGGDDEIARVDVASAAVTHLAVPGRAAPLGLAVDGSGVWVATRAAIVVLDPESGTERARLPGDATRVVVTGGEVWARRGTELLRIDPASAQILEYLPGYPAGGPVVLDDGRLWIAGPPGGSSGEIVLFEASTRRVVARATFPGGIVDAAVTSSGIWITTDESPGILRFARP